MSNKEKSVKDMINAKGIVILCGIDAIEANEKYNLGFDLPNQNVHPVHILRLGRQIVDDFFANGKPVHVIATQQVFVEAITNRAWFKGVEDDVQIIVAHGGLIEDYTHENTLRLFWMLHENSSDSEILFQ